MESIGIIGLVFGILGMGQAAHALSQIKELKAQLRKAGVTLVAE